MRLVDSHCHIQATAFDADREAMLDTAAAEGVERVLVPGWNVASSRAAVELARAATDRPATDAASGPLRLLAAVGIHPHEAAGADDEAWADVLALAADPCVAAIGETGLDYDRAFSPRDAQLRNLRRHLALAFRTGRPAILHCRSKPGERDAQDDLIAELGAAGARAVDGAGAPAVLHSFSGPGDYAAAALELGLMISFSGLVFRAGEEASGEVARATPADRLLIETDSPYLSPPGAPRRRNEPRYVETTARWLAEIRAMDQPGLGEQLVANYDRTFGAAE